MPIDQAHEQNNEVIKDSGGVVGLTESPAILRRWMVAGLESARVITEFDEQILIEDYPSDFLQHE